MTFGATARTLRCFVASYHDLIGVVQGYRSAQPGRQGRLTRPDSRPEPATLLEARWWPSRHPNEAAVLPILSHYINGTAVEVLPENTGPVYNPATGQVIARVPRGGQAEVDAAVAAAKAAFPAWRDMPLIARSNIFFAFRDAHVRAPRGAGAR